jgi:hypothetical protein|uniref:Uncharacterized protein n=1 Tax=Siphoviridae sp. ctHMI2 TaxID=2826231 RepID=A0A8S5MJF1_9CAUD|nr:MAG TPA: hypothetical protein [Siphoviridae sp. ctHMI2]
MKTIGFIGCIEFHLYIQSLWKYKQFYLMPGVMVEGIKGHGFYFEIKFLCLAVGVRLVCIKAQKNH